MKILVTDDSKTGLAILTAALEKLGHEVIGATSGEAAIELFLKTKPDFMILDVVMQTMSGFECAKKLREIHNQSWIPIIFLSATIDDEHISKGIDAGGDDYLAKPFTEVMLAAKIKAMQRISDVQKKLQETTHELSILSTTDTLTGLDNRLQFDNCMKEHFAYAKRYNVRFAVLYIDIDHFKSINDKYGHQIGDTLLKEVAKRLKSCLRESDLLARIGGDEFIVIIKQIDREQDAISVAKKILKILLKNYHLANHDLQIGCSIGISDYPKTATNPELLIKQADEAMYSVKKTGRANYKYYGAL